MRKNNSGNRAPSFSIVHVALLILCAVMLTTHLTGGLNARYVSSAEGSDSARVAKFGDITITETGDDKTTEGEYLIIPGVNIKKNPLLSFAGSESATYVFVEITLGSDWKSTDNMSFHNNAGVSWTVGSDWQYLPDTANPVYYYITGTTEGVISPNTVIVDSQIIKDSTITVSNTITAADINGSDFDDLGIAFRATAVQSIGFENVNAAWASISAKGG